MSWANCGEDSRGRPIGYAHNGKCDHPGCNVKINRGLAHACGDMHGFTEYGCEKYFCEDHRWNFAYIDQNRYTRICDECAQDLINSDEWTEVHGSLIRTEPTTTTS